MARAEGAENRLEAEEAARQGAAGLSETGSRDWDPARFGFTRPRRLRPFGTSLRGIVAAPPLRLTGWDPNGSFRGRPDWPEGDAMTTGPISARAEALSCLRSSHFTGRYA